MLYDSAWAHSVILKVIYLELIQECASLFGGKYISDHHVECFGEVSGCQGSDLTAQISVWLSC